MTGNTVLLVTASYDEAADLVAMSLDRASVPSFRLNTDLFPQEVTISFNPHGDTIFSSENTIMSGRQIRSVWYRRNVVSELPASVDSYHQEFCQRESRAFLDGALATLQTNRWLSKPTDIWKAEHKVYQLSVAKHLGFDVPPTIVTNDKDEARNFGSDKELVAKAVSSGYINSPTGYSPIFTSAVSHQDLDDLDGLSLSPVIFQEKTKKRSDIRVTVIGEEIFAAEILSQKRQSSMTDWRATDDPQLEHRIHQLPAYLEHLCTSLVSYLGLHYGAIDLALNVDGAYTFFEINPNGEWLWLEYQLGFPISERIAKWLSR